MTCCERGAICVGEKKEKKRKEKRTKRRRPRGPFLSSPIITHHPPAKRGREMERAATQRWMVAPVFIEPEVAQSKVEVKWVPLNQQTDPPSLLKNGESPSRSSSSSIFHHHHYYYYSHFVFIFVFILLIVKTKEPAPQHRPHDRSSFICPSCRLFTSSPPSGTAIPQRWSWGEQ